MYKSQHTSSWTLAVAILVLSAVACSSDSTEPTSPDVVSVSGPITTTTAFNSQVSTSEILQAMEHAIQDEYHAEDH